MTRRPFAWLLAVVPILAGCVHFKEKDPEDLLWHPADTVPEESKAEVYIFLFDTLDPLAGGSLASVRDHLHHLGFGKTYYGWSHHLRDFMVELQVVSSQRPNTRFVVIGYGVGAPAARKLALSGESNGIPIDLSIYLEPRGLDSLGETDPALGTFTLTSADLGCSDGQDSIHKSSVPTHPKTLELIEREITLVALGIPPPPRPTAVHIDLVTPIPAPRESNPMPKKLPPDWEFLRPRHPWETPPFTPPLGNETLPLPKAAPDLPRPRPVQDEPMPKTLGRPK
jgi:hypothetical protein